MAKRQCFFHRRAAEVDIQVDHTINRAITFLNAGRPEAAVEQLHILDKRLINDPIRCNLIGLIRLAAQAREEALEWFERALLLDPRFTDAWFNMGMILRDLRRPAEALRAYEHAIELGTRNPDLYYHRGLLLRDLGRQDEAIASLDQALALQPDHPAALHAGGQILRANGHFEIALEFYDRALSLRPQFAEALMDRGTLLQTMKRIEEALACYDKADALQPDNAELLNNRGIALQQLGRFTEALADVEKAIALKPDLAEAWLNKGNIYIYSQMPEQALTCLEKALDLRPSYGEAMSSRAVALHYAGQFDEALAAYDAALAAHPNLIHARNNKAGLLLLLGRFAEGLDHYEFRWIAGQTLRTDLKTSLPEWNGQFTCGERVLVVDEQGLGDAIQFSRYLPLMATRGMQVTFLCRRKLHRLFHNLGTAITIIDAISGEDQFDSQIALSSLPRAFKTRLETIPAAPFYLHAEDRLIHSFASRIGSQNFRVGLCWQGSQNLAADPSRSIPLAAFKPFAGLDHLRLINLQQGADLTQLHADGLMIEDYGVECDTSHDAFVETAALMHSLDLIITCDTSIAHLAGALGRPVWVLLKPIPDWRWLLNREDSPWYPSMRLFRRNQEEDWEGLMNRIRPVLQAVIANGLDNRQRHART